MGETRKILIVHGGGDRLGKSRVGQMLAGLAEMRGIEVEHRSIMDMAAGMNSGRAPAMVVLDELSAYPVMPDIPRKDSIEQAMPYVPNNRKARRAARSRR